MMRRSLAIATVAVCTVVACSQTSDPPVAEPTTAATAATTTPPTETTAAATTTTTTATTTTAAATTTSTAAVTTTIAAAVAELDLVYGTWQEQPLTLDLYGPAESADAPIVVYLPGSNESGAPAFLVEGLVEDGAMVFVVRYAQIDVGPTELINDLRGNARADADSVACAIRFARERASEFGSDDPFVALTGLSLGGGVAAHVALFGDTVETRWSEFETEGGPSRSVECDVTGGSTQVDALVGMAGTYDVFVPIYDGKWGRTYQQENDPALWEFLTSSIGANTDLQVRLLHGESDGTPTFENSAEFAAALTEAGYDVGQVIPFDGGHTVSREMAVPTIREVIVP